jgi:glutamate racemase
LKPIGVFDSGIGGLSVLRALIAELPHEDFVYFADTAHAPYGERDNAYVIERARVIAQRLREAHAIKALVVACNTATAAAIDLLRNELPGLLVVGVEPALKPAVAISKTHRIGVMATRGTLASAKFRALHDAHASQAEFMLQPCDGLADAIESGDLARTRAFCEQYVGALSGVDTLVLGCTHYPFARDAIAAAAGAGVTLVDTGEPVARQTRRVLERSGQLKREGRGNVELLSSGSVQALQAAAARWLDCGQGGTDYV